MQYLVIDYTNYGVDRNNDPDKIIYKLISEEELFKIIQKAKDNDLFPCIAVYKMPQNALIDWS